MSEVWFIALGLVLALEGLTYALVPGQMKRLMQQMQDIPEDKLRLFGTVVLALGVFVIWLAQGSA